MSRTYEFLEDRMSYLNKDTFNKYYGMRMYYQFMPKVGDITCERARTMCIAVQGILGETLSLMMNFSLFLFLVFLLIVLGFLLSMGV